MTEAVSQPFRISWEDEMKCQPNQGYLAWFWLALGKLAVAVSYKALAPEESGE